MFLKVIRAIVLVLSKKLHAKHNTSRCSLAATPQCVLAPWQLLLGRWPDEDVALRGVEVDVCIARISFSSDDYDESLSPCTSVLKSNIRVERSESNRGTLTTLIYPRTFLPDP
jgi:hypothetical protein